METSLQKSIAGLEKQTGTQFLYDGRPLLDVTSKLWEERQVEKENEMKESQKTL